MKGVIPWQTDGDWPHSLAELEIDLRRTALIVVDVQNYSKKNSAIVPQCLRLREFFHQHGLEVIYLRVGSLLPGRRDMHRKRAIAWMVTPEGDPPMPMDVHPGTHNHDIVEELLPLDGELVINKNSSGAFNSSSIDRYLQAMGVQNLVFCGSATSRCVDNTARGAADRGYNVMLIEDACIDPVDRNHCTTMRTFGRAFGSVKTTDQVLSQLGALAGDEHAQVPAGA